MLLNPVTFSHYSLKVREGLPIVLDKNQGGTMCPKEQALLYLLHPNEWKESVGTETESNIWNFLLHGTQERDAI